MMEFDRTKFEFKLQQETKLEETRKARGNNTKLPKLVITKFNGTHVDCRTCFWNQFEAEIDLAEIFVFEGIG